jgi:hypothetical protein
LDVIFFGAPAALSCSALSRVPRLGPSGFDRMAHKLHDGNYSLNTDDRNALPTLAPYGSRPVA